MTPTVSGRGDHPRVPSGQSAVGADDPPSSRRPPRASSRSRIARGRKSQQIVADFLREHGWPDARPVPAFAPGRDVLGVPGVAIEVKATADKPLEGLRQAKRNADGDRPCVVWRPNGYGPERVAEWPVLLTLGEFAGLLRAAGYVRCGHDWITRGGGDYPWRECWLCGAIADGAA